jgi:excisionase family DNA binding protein
MAYGDVVQPVSEWISTGQAAAILNISRETVHSRLQSGEIAFRRPKVHYQVNFASVLEYRDRHLRAVDFTDYTEERWLPVVGYEDLYHVSDKGRVRNCKPSRRILRNKIEKTGYHRLALCRPGSPRRLARVHRLVLEAFVGPCPPGMEACHEDCDAGNNTLANLRWDTHEANLMDSARRRSSQAGGSSKPLCAAPYRTPTKTHCSRRHPHSEWNTAIRFRGSGCHRCIACERARAIVNETRRRTGRVLDVDVVAEQQFGRLQAEHESRQVA